MKSTSSSKGFFFSFDALIALSILLIAFIYVAGLRPPSVLKFTEYEQMHMLSADAMQIFAGTSFSSLDEPMKSSIVSAANLSSEDMNKSLLDIVGILWGMNKTVYAANMTRDFLSGILANATNYSLVVEESGNPPGIIYNSSDMAANRRVLSSTSRIVSGYKANTNVTGFVARAFIESAKKRMQSYAYFGGFEGNGNITKVLALPTSIDTINEIYLEMDTPSNFTLYINGNYSGAYNVSNRTALRAKNWTVDSMYDANIIPGSNNVTLAFRDINSAYVGGGFIRIKYNTTLMDTSDIKMNADRNVTERYYFPGIDGLINLYSSFYVPGILRSMGARLHYFSNYTVYLIIGNVSVYENSTNATQAVYLNNTALGSLLDYSMFNQTMPIRFGTKNITGLSEGSDVVLITDLSGSMIQNCDVDASSGSDCNGGRPGIQHWRIDVAKESDREFISVILANSGQKAGIVAFNDTTVNSKTMYLTDNITMLNNTINSYAAAGWTCTSCGIQTSIDMLVSTINVTTPVANKSLWSYNNSFSLSGPPPDLGGRNWTDVNYSLVSSWKTGNAVFGNDTTTISSAYLPNTATNISANGAGVRLYGDLWDMYADRATPEVDFTSGMNYTVNKFGLGNGFNGWNWGAKYDYDNSSITYGKAIGGKIVFSTFSGSPFRNRCASYDCSGGYGIQINITPEQYAIISSGGDAYVSFEYSWKSIGFTRFTIYDELWIKGNWTSPTSGGHPLGNEMQSAYGDTTPEIDNIDDPYFNLTGNFVQNITRWIEGPGMYYLDFGGKLYTDPASSGTSKGGNFSFDNVLLEFSNKTDITYFRKNFSVSNIDSIGKGILKVMSDDGAEVYLNGALVLNDSTAVHNAAYWNSVSIINRKYFQQGNNIVAVKLFNRAGSSRFNLEITALNDSRNKAMLVMSDGEANTLIGGAGGNDPDKAPVDAINRSCLAYERYGIISHAVAFGSGIGSSTLKTIAECGRGTYATSNNEDDLKSIYRDIANSIITYTTQAAEISGETTIAKLYADSYIEYNYTPEVNLNYGDISLTRESDTFGNTSGNYSVESPKNGSYNITSNMVILDAKATSYSADSWTNALEAKNQSATNWITVFNLSKFGSSYGSLGDPYIVNIPASLVTPGQMNYVRINTAKNFTQPTGGSPDDRVIYSVKVKGSVDYGATNETLKGAIEDAKSRLMANLSEFGITPTDINTETMDIGKIPWMWGPATITLEVWR